MKKELGAKRDLSRRDRVKWRTVHASLIELALRHLQPLSL